MQPIKSDAPEIPGKDSPILRWALVAALAAFLAKLYCAATTVGTTDVFLYYGYGKTAALGGLEKLYQLPHCNLTPVQAWFAAWVYRTSPKDIEEFGLILKLPGMLAHLATTALALLVCKFHRSISPGSLVVFALSPISFMVDGFHGNLDSVMTFLMFLSVVFCARGSLFPSALCLAIAAQVKISALLIGPILAFRFINGRFLLFCLHVGWITILGLLPGILAAPGAFLSQVLNYGSNFGVWGFPYLLRLTGLPEFQPINWAKLTGAERQVGTILKLLIISIVCWIGWSRRKDPPERIFGSVAHAWTIFFAFAPGFGIQYLVWPGPFLALYNRRWFATYIVTASISAFVYYNIYANGMPWYSTPGKLAETWALRIRLQEWCLVLPWAASLVGAALVLRSLFRRDTPKAEPSDGPMLRDEPKGSAPGTPL
jgi:hypothetical protein